jgi:hypothetical protein
MTCIASLARCHSPIVSYPNCRSERNGKSRLELARIGQSLASAYVVRDMRPAIVVRVCRFGA